MKKLPPHKCIYLESDALKMINYDEDEHILEGDFYK
jgi:hypothetical protein